MANELQVDATTGRTIYFLVRSAVATIWNGATLVAYATANLGTYAIAATEQGTASGYYVANMPAVAAGVYYIIAKIQAGGSPAEGDLTIGGGPMEWSGTAPLPLSGVAATVITTANVNTIADGVLSRNVSNVEGSAAKQSLCGAALKLTSKFSAKDAANGNNAVTYKTDGTTVFMQQVPVTDATMTPIRSLGVGA